MHSHELPARLSLTLDELADSLGLTDAVLERRLQALQLTSADRDRLHEFWSKHRLRGESFVVGLYEKLKHTPQLSAMLQHESRVERLIVLQKQYLNQLFSANMDFSYILSRLRIGVVHHRIRVTPQWYIATYSHFLTYFIDLFLDETRDWSESITLLDALQKCIFLDTSLVLDAYGHVEDSLNEEKNAQSRQMIPEEERASILASNASIRSPDYTVARIRISDDDTRSRQSFIEIDQNDTSSLAQLRPFLEEILPEILQEFYTFIENTPELARKVRQDQIDRLISQVSAYWREFVVSRFDRRHAASRMRIGVIHESIRLDPQWYLLGLSRQISGILRNLPADLKDGALILKAFLRGICFDVTFVIDAYMESRAASLLEFQGYARQLMAGLTSAVAVINPQNRIVSANEIFLELAGVEPSMLYMMELESIFPRGEVLETLNRKRTEHLDRACCMVTLGERLYRVTMVRLQESSSTPRNSTAIVFDDVSDVIHLSQNIEQDTSQLKQLINAVNAVVWEMDWETRIIHSISHPAIDLTGHRDVSFLGRPYAWENCIAACDRKRFETACGALSYGSQTVCEYRLQRADQREIWVRSHLSRLPRGGSYIIAAVTTDVTRERQSDHLRLVALEDVAAGVVNVINNALTVIHANIELEMETKGPRAGQQSSGSRYLAEAQHAAHRAAKVLSQIRVFAKGQFLRSRLISVNDVIVAANHPMRLQCGPLIRFETDLLPNIWMVRTDPDQLALALGHLSENAGRAMPSGGVLRVSSRNVSSETMTPDDPGFLNEWVEIILEDSGHGMPPHVLQRAIEPFFSTDSSADRFGLGLSMVYGFVSQSGGHLYLHSTEGVGTRITMRFPKAVTGTEFSGNLNQPEEKSPVVLIVDSDESVRLSTSQLAERLGHRTVTARNSAGALDALRHHRISILITDLPLSEGEDGMTLARRMTEQVSGLGVVLMTGSASLDQLNQSVPEDWVILEKPFSRDELAKALEGATRAKGVKTQGRFILSVREREVLHWIAAGKSQAETAVLLRISERTVEQHVRNAKLKLNAVNTIQAVVDAIALGEITRATDQNI